MHEKHASSTSGGCATDGVDPAFQTGHSSSSSDGSCDPVRDEDQKASLEGPSREVPGAATAGMGDGDAFAVEGSEAVRLLDCLLYTSPSPRDLSTSRMPSSA